MERVTIKELARMSNVSAKTVSKALNDQPGVSEGLRASVKKLAKDFNYIPNLFGRGLKGRSTKTIGVIISDNSNPNYSEMIKGIETKAREFDYNIILCNSNESLILEEKQIQLLIQKQVDGVILAPVPDFIDSKRVGLERLKQLGIPYILTNRHLEGEEKNCVKTDNVLGGYLATKYLIGKGHKEIIYLTPQKTISPSSERITGYKKALADANIPVSDTNIYKCDSISLESSCNTMLDILRERRDFTAVFSFNDIVAFGVIKALYECRLRIPSDISIIGYDDIPYSQICLVPLTTVRQESNLIGVTAMEILLDRINGDGTSERKQMVFIPQIIERMSV